MKFFLSWRQLLYITIAFVSFFVGGILLSPIYNKREKYRVTEHRVLENAPPELVIATTALGGFRAILVDYLWLRVMDLQKDGKYYEMVQLCNWIGMLEPRLPEIWSFHAWNMAYNISVVMQNGEDRWRWILIGIEYLRDKGIRYNPNTAKLYWELAWIFLDKIGLTSVDDYRRYYQIEWSKTMSSVLGQNPDIKAMAEAPKTLKELRLDPDIDGILSRSEKAGIDLSNDLFSSSAEKKGRAETFLNQESPKESTTALITFLRAYRLRNVYKMEPQNMLSLMDKFGPLDWNMWYTHALYWAEEGVKCMDRFPKQFKDALNVKNYDRLKLSALKQAFLQGRVVVQLHGINLLPQFRFLKPVHEAFEEVEKKWGGEDIGDHKTFLEWAVFSAYLFGYKDLAREYFDIMKKKWTDPEYKNGLDNFVITKIRGEIQYLARKDVIEAYIVGVYFHSLLAYLKGDQKLCFNLQEFSWRIYEEYRRRIGDPDAQAALEKPKPFSYFQTGAFMAIELTLGKKMRIQLEKELKR